MESPINVMSRLHYNWIMSKRMGPRRKPSNPGKICNFEGRVNGSKVFFRNFTYKCDFMVLEDTTSVIDHDLGLVVFEKLFVEATGLVYDREEGTITFEKDKEKIVFKMPHKIEMFKHIDFTDMKTNCIPPFVIESDDDNSKKIHYSDSLDLGPEYKHDENVCRAIRSLIAMKAKRNKGEVTKFLIKNEEKSSQYVETASGLNPTASRLQQCEDSKFFKLYLTRRSLEVLRKFHWTTLGGRSNQLSHVSSPLLSKPREY
ncbi:hypothetical protein Tco_1128544 [Tanacetum coccineum]